MLYIGQLVPVIKITSRAKNFLKGDRLSFLYKKYTIKYPNLDLIKINLYHIDLSTNRKAVNFKENLNQIYFLLEYSRFMIQLTRIFFIFFNFILLYWMD